MPASSFRNSASRPLQSAAASARRSAAPLPADRQCGARAVQQTPVQAPPHFPVRIPQTVHGQTVRVLLLVGDGQVAGLEQKGLGRDGVHVEGRQQCGVGAQALEVRGGEAAPQQRVDQEPRRRRLEPVRFELTGWRTGGGWPRGCRPAPPPASCSRCTRRGSGPGRGRGARVRTRCRGPPRCSRRRPRSAGPG